MDARKQRARRAGRLEAGGTPAAQKGSTVGEQTSGRGFAARAGTKFPGLYRPDERNRRTWKWGERRESQAALGLSLC